MAFSSESFLKICEEVAQNSKCLSRKIGAVIVKDGVIVSTGYNGPPRGVPHCDKRHHYDDKLKKEYKKLFLSSEIYKCPRKLLGFKSGEGLEWCVAGHAERNALINCAREGISTKGCSMYMSCPISCTPCLVEIINAGIKEIIVTEFSFYDLSGEFLVRNSDLKVKNFEGFEFYK